MRASVLGMLLACSLASCSKSNDIDVAADDPCASSDAGPGATVCAESCVDTQVSSAHCGACDNPCPAGGVCTAGTCECPSPLALCANACVDATADSNHCGGCNASCPTERVCNGGECGCALGKKLCGNACVDVQNDPNHCGECDFACGGPCALGACQQITDVAPGGNDICASVSGRIWCLGQGGRREIALPIFPSSVAAGLDHFCAGDVSEGLYCWGDNSRGQIGAGLAATTLFEAAKVPFPAGQSPELFSLGAFHSCAFLEDDQDGSPLRVHCWGANDSMQSGSAQQDDVDVPTRVENTDSAPGVWHALAVGSRHGCALLGDARVVCWGDNTLGELGQGGTSPASSHVALEVTNPDSFTTNPRAVAVGLGFSCWLDSQGGVRCWGTSRGTGSESPVLQPTLVQGLPSKATEVVASSGHACARVEGGKVYCWGESDDGASGSLDPSTTPKEIAGLSDVTAVRTGIVNSCAILASGTVRCWGTNSHQALDSSDSKTTTPTALRW